MIPYADVEGPDQTAHPRSLILAFAVRTCPLSALGLRSPQADLSLRWAHVQTSRKSCAPPQIAFICFYSLAGLSYDIYLAGLNIIIR